MTKKRQGKTLIEVVVASGLMLLITASLVQVMIHSKQRLRRYERLVDMEEQAIRCLTQLNADLSESHINSIENPSANFLVFPSPRQVSGELVVDPNGELLWSTMLCYREETINGERSLIRQGESIPDSPGEATHPDSLVPPADLGFFLAGTGPKRMMARGFESLSLSTVSEGVLRVQVQLSVQLARKTQGIRLSSQVAPRN